MYKFKLFVFQINTMEARRKEFFSMKLSTKTHLKFVDFFTKNYEIIRNLIQCGDVLYFKQNQINIFIGLYPFNNFIRLQQNIPKKGVWRFSVFGSYLQVFRLFLFLKSKKHVIKYKNICALGKNIHMKFK